MAAYLGKNGSVRVGATKITLIDSWSINPSVEIVDITSYGSTFKNKVQTIRDWKASFTMTLDRSDAQQVNILSDLEGSSTDAGNIALRFYTSSAAYWSGNGLVAGITINSKVSDKVSVSVNVEGNGALTYV